MPQRLGPILFGPSLVKSWQFAHFLEIAWPAPTSALASRPETGSITAGAAGGAPPAVSVPAVSARGNMSRPRIDRPSPWRGDGEGESNSLGRIHETARRHPCANVVLAPARQAAGRYPWRAHDRPCLAPRAGGRRRPRAGGGGRERNRRGGGKGWRSRAAHPGQSSLRF